MSNRLTVAVGMIQQRLPRRKQPSLPRVGLEGVARQRVRYEPPQDGRRKIDAMEQERLFGEGAAAPLQTDGHQLFVGAGTTKDGRRARMLSTAEIMRMRGTIDAADWEACRVASEYFVPLLGCSEGVCSYGLSPGGSDPTAKGDRRGTALTGYTIAWRAGQAAMTPDDMRSARGRQSRLRDAALLMRAAVGVQRRAGRWVFDESKAVLLVRCVVPSAKPPTLDRVGTAFTLYGPHSKQKTAAAAGMLREMFSRMAMHLGLKEGSAWSDQRVQTAVELAST